MKILKIFKTLIGVATSGYRIGWAFLSPVLSDIYSICPAPILVKIGAGWILGGTFILFLCL